MPKFARTPKKTERARVLRREVSATEYKLWLYLRGGQSGASFRRQHPVGPYFIDYYCAALKFAVEVDGPWHHMHRDQVRDEFLLARGISVLRISVGEVDESLEAVGERIWTEVALLKAQQTPL
tara:strand:- start:3232 stop:3600 length:369 start_codon:yes stop_codon:yes gene_type:complete